MVQTWLRVGRSSRTSARVGSVAPAGANQDSYNPGWRIYRKMSDLTQPTPANAWIFADETMYTLNDGYLQCDLATPGYPDVPAKYHSGGNCFSFADGHTEYRKWKYVTSDPTVGLLNAPYAKNVVNGGTRWGSSGLDVDWKWLREHTSCPP